jgi:hypothetical protein
MTTTENTNPKMILLDVTIPPFESLCLIMPMNHNALLLFWCHHGLCGMVKHQFISRPRSGEGKANAIHGLLTRIAHLDAQFTISTKAEVILRIDSEQA